MNPIRFHWISQDLILKTSWIPSNPMIFYKEFWKNGFQQRGLINHVLAKRFINPGGPPVFKLHFFLGGGG